MRPKKKPLPDRYRRLAFGLVAFCLAVVTLLWVAAVRHIERDRREATEAAIRQNNNLALAFEQHTLSTLKSAEQALLHLQRAREAGGGQGAVARLLRQETIDPRLFAFAAILDERGAVIDAAGATGALAGRAAAWVARHRGEDDRSLFIGNGISATPEGGVIALTRRLSLRDGRFAGVLAVGLKQAHFSAFYNLVDLKRHGMVMLLGPDATVLARRAGPAHSFGERIPDSQLVAKVATAPAGHYVTRGRADGIARFLSYREVAGSPLVVAVATSVDEMLAEATARRQDYYFRASLVTALVLLFAAGVVLALRRQGAASAAAQRSEAYYRATFDQAGVAISHCRPDGRLLRANPAFCALLGYEEAELLGLSIYELTHPHDLAETREAGRRLAEGAPVPAYEKRYLRKDGTPVWTIAAPTLVRDVGRGGEYVLNMVQDISERKAAEERRMAHLRYQERIARFGHDALGVRDAAELIDMAAQTLLEGLRADAVAYVERAPGESALLVRALVGAPSGGAGEIARYAADQAIARVLAERRAAQLHELPAAGAALPFAWAQAMQSAVLAPVSSDAAARGALCALAREAAAFRREEAGFVEALASLLSAGLQRLDSEGQLAFLAQFDSLTGLPNRALFADRFSQAIAQAKRHGTLLGVLFIDLDHFKLVNDTLGHAAGDELLREAARRLQAAVRAGDTVGRISGDEFAVLLAELARPEDAALAAQRIIAGLAEPVYLRGQEVYVTASIGASSFPADGEDLEALLAAADAAMYRAKQSGRNTYQFFTPEINARTNARLQIAAELRHALERDELALVYQPKFDLKSARPCGAEALLRWKHPERGLVAPAEFVPVLEETGLIIPVGDWVLRRTCRDIRAWLEAGLEALPVAVNLSARQFAQPDLDKRIGSVLQAEGLPPALVELEITESHIVNDPEHAVRNMRALVAQGVRLSIDDFGTGYSSLSYLTRFPVAALKIDRSFVANALEDEADAVIVRTIIDMGHTLRFTVVAEGVETQAQAAFLRNLGCDVAQGYLFGRPMAEAELRALMLPGKGRKSGGVR